jgi:hypothetical protein
MQLVNPQIHPLRLLHEHICNMHQTDTNHFLPSYGNKWVASFPNGRSQPAAELGLIYLPGLTHLLALLAVLAHLA